MAESTLSGKADVIDGDSLRIDGIEIRLWGIDALEYHQTCNQDGRTWHCGKVAARVLRERLRNREIRCLVRDRDRHGRWVCECHDGPQSINRWMVLQGWALDFKRYSQGQYAATEKAARIGRRGAWNSAFVPPEQWRRANPR